MNGARESLSRRDFLGALTVATAAGLAVSPEPAAAEPPPETRRIRIAKVPAICLAQLYLAEDLQRGEGFTDVQYVEMALPQIARSVASGSIDLSAETVTDLIMELDGGGPIVIVGGLHVGCYELVGTDRIRKISDLMGKTVAVADRGRRAFIASMAVQVGLDPARDIHWAETSGEDAMQLLAAGKVDAYLGFPPEPQEMRARRIGHVVVDTAKDRPWSQYFCCMLFSNREFVRRNPVAAKRALRAILKADRICATEPDRAARTIVDRGFTSSYDYALQTMKDVPYGRWRKYDPADAIRFYALRLREAGMIKASPAEAHQPGHRLAIPRRAEERTEGLDYSHSPSGTKIDTRGAGPTSRVPWPWPVRSSAMRMSPGPRRRTVPSPISMSTAPDSVNTA
jgi:NitT/TauT family transport system substrate-binding protein